MADARLRSGAFIAALADIPDPGAVVRDFAAGEARFSLLVTRAGAQAAAFENACPHARWPLETPTGAVLVQDGAYVVCAAHGASFCLRTGAVAAGPARRGLTPFPIVVTDGAIKAA